MMVMMMMSNPLNLLFRESISICLCFRAITSSYMNMCIVVGCPHTNASIFSLFLVPNVFKYMLIGCSVKAVIMQITGYLSFVRFVKCMQNNIFKSILIEVCDIQK